MKNKTLNISNVENINEINRYNANNLDEDSDKNYKKKYYKKNNIINK